MKPLWLAILVVAALSISASALSTPPSPKLSTYGDAMAIAQASATGGFHVLTNSPNPQGAPYSPEITLHPPLTERAGYCLEQYNVIVARDAVDAAYAGLFGMTPQAFLNAASISFDLDGQPLPVMRTANKWNEVSGYWFFSVYWILPPGALSPGTHTFVVHFAEPGFSAVFPPETFTMGGFGSGFCPGD